MSTGLGDGIRSQHCDAGILPTTGAPRGELPWMDRDLLDEATISELNKFLRIEYEPVVIVVGKPKSSLNRSRKLS